MNSLLFAGLRASASFLVLRPELQPHRTELQHPICRLRCVEGAVALACLLSAREMSTDLHLYHCANTPRVVFVHTIQLPVSMKVQESSGSLCASILRHVCSLPDARDYTREIFGGPKGAKQFSGARRLCLSSFFFHHVERGKVRGGGNTNQGTIYLQGHASTDR